MSERIRAWVLVHGNRYVVAICLLAVLSGIALLPAFTGLQIRNTSPLFYVSSGLITGNITLVTVVVAITQLVLSRELEAPGEVQSEVEKTAEYRHDALDQRAIPVKPATFLQQLVRQIREKTRELDAAITERMERRSNDEFELLLADLPDHCEHVDEQIERADAKLFGVIAPMLGTDYADYIHGIHRIQDRSRDEADEQVHDVLEQLASDLENLDIARQYFTTIVIKEELAVLSRSLLYVGIPAVAIPMALLIHLTRYASGATPATDLLAGVALTTIAGLLPLAVLAAFVLRIASVAQRIASITPFKTQY